MQTFDREKMLSSLSTLNHAASYIRDGAEELLRRSEEVAKSPALRMTVAEVVGHIDDILALINLGQYNGLGDDFSWVIDDIKNVRTLLDRFRGIAIKRMTDRPPADISDSDDDRYARRVRDGIEAEKVARQAQEHAALDSLDRMLRFIKAQHPTLKVTLIDRETGDKTQY